MMISCTPEEEITLSCMKDPVFNVLYPYLIHVIEISPGFDFV